MHSDEVPQRVFEVQRALATMAKTLRFARKTHKLTQTEFALRILTSLTLITRFENGSILIRTFLIENKKTSGINQR